MSALPEALSWGRYPRLAQRRIVPAWADQLPALLRTAPVLPYGAGRSYGDSCQNAGGTLIDMHRIDRLLAFDDVAGEITVEAGATLQELSRVTLPRGWWLPVNPGTQHVTVGGAIANDVHGKNHHVAGTFGRHVRGFALLRSDAPEQECVPGDALFAATVGGLGLTGLVTRARLGLRRVSSTQLDAESLAFGTLDEFFALSSASRGWEYTVAWVDCASRATLGRGVFRRARHVGAADGTLERLVPPRRKAVPLDFPAFALNRAAIRAFNALYFRLAPHRLRTVDMTRFLFPLDALQGWNRIYGRRGFVQFQCVVPNEEAPRHVHELLRTVAHAGQGSFLSVLKTFGDMPPPGMLSFPRPGVTFALDFPMRGEATRTLLARLEAQVLEAGGAIYPAKDACMSARAFRAAYPGAERFAAFVDPAFSSSFWRRVEG